MNINLFGTLGAALVVATAGMATIGAATVGAATMAVAQEAAPPPAPVETPHCGGILCDFGLFGGHAAPVEAAPVVAPPPAAEPAPPKAHHRKRVKHMVKAPAADAGPKPVEPIAAH
jgi:hypothetical protein